jgi:hypothetical protein
MSVGYYMRIALADAIKQPRAAAVALTDASIGQNLVGC